MSSIRIQLLFYRYTNILEMLWIFWLLNFTAGINNYISELYAVRNVITADERYCAAFIPTLAVSAYTNNCTNSIVILTWHSYGNISKIDLIKKYIHFKWINILYRQMQAMFNWWRVAIQIVVYSFFMYVYGGHRRCWGVDRKTSSSWQPQIIQNKVSQTNSTQEKEHCDF